MRVPGSPELFAQKFAALDRPCVWAIGAGGTSRASIDNENSMRVLVGLRRLLFDDLLNDLETPRPRVTVQRSASFSITSFLPQTDADPSVHENQRYMQSMLRYDCINSHLRMIWDELRCHAYATAISRAIKPGDVVIDFGCGLGIWSMIAAKAGASRVYAIEAVDDMADMAQALTAENNLSDRITVIHANAESVDLPEKADCLISELMNGAGFNEYDGEPLMKVRDRFLKPGGRMIPQRIRHVIRLCHLRTDFAPDDGHWADGMYGLTWHAVKDFASASSTATDLRNYAWASSPHVWWDLDLMRDDLSGNQYRDGIPAHWEIQTATTVQGVAAYFEADLDDNIMLSTSPDAPFTHWMHTLLSFPRALEVRAGDRLSVKVSFSTGRGAATYPLSVVWTRDGNILDQFDTYPTSIPGTPLLSAESAGAQQEASL